MHLKVNSMNELGQVIRVVRKRQSLRIDDFAMLAGVSKQFVGDVEAGKPTAQIGKVLHVLAQLGIGLEVTVRAEDFDAVEAAKRKTAERLPQTRPKPKRGA